MRTAATLRGGYGRGECGKGVTATSAGHRKGISERRRRVESEPVRPRLQGLQEFDDGVLIRAGQLSEAFGDVASFAAVSEDGVGEGQGRPIMH